MTVLHRAVWLLFGASCLALSVDSARLAAAASLASGGTVESLHRAVRIWPHHGGWFRALAVLEPESADAWLDRALGLNPRDTRAWMRLGMHAEAEGRTAEAERALLRAAAFDGTYEPRWALANFYFRQGNTAAFWSWAGQAAKLGREDLTPLFDLAWRTRPDAEDLLARIVPPACAPRRAFLEYLRNANELDAALTAARPLAGCADPGSRSALERFADSLLLDGRPEPALRLWNQLIQDGGGPSSEPLDPAAGRVLSNGDFARVPSRLAFDWHFDAVPGVTVVSPRGGNRLRVDLDGTEPDAFAVLYQPVPVLPKSAYRLSMEIRAPGSEVPPGFRWRLADLRTGAAVTDDGADLAGEAGSRAWSLHTAAVPVHVLALIYQRPVGHTRLQGTIELEHINLVPEPAAARALLGNRRAVQ